MRLGSNIQSNSHGKYSQGHRWLYYNDKSGIQFLLWDRMLWMVRIHPSNSADHTWGQIDSYWLSNGQVDKFTAAYWWEWDLWSQAVQPPEIWETTGHCYLDYHKWAHTATTRVPESSSEIKIHTHVHPHHIHSQVSPLTPSFKQGILGCRQEITTVSVLHIGA